ncbi:hypothetical protein ACSBR1_027935 [Camellia fascicularis]
MRTLFSTKSSATSIRNGEHSSVDCFITHCGSGSLFEALVNTCQLVLLPNVGDQIINARMMSKNLKVGVEVEK